METSIARNDGARPVLVGWDGSEQARDAIALAGTLAREIGADVEVVHAGPLHGTYPGSEPVLEVEAQRLLDDAPMELLAGMEASRRLVHSTSPARGLHRAIDETGAQLVVLGSTHRGTIGRIMLGSVATHLLHGSPCPVAVAPLGYADAPPESMQTVAVAYDASPESRAAVDAALGVATKAGATLRVISVATPPGMGWASAGVVYPLPDTLADRHERCRQAVEALLAEVPDTVRPEGRLLDGEPGPAILSECEKDVDLLVMGSRGYGTVGRVLLGSVSSAVIRSAPCPVLVVPQAATKRRGQQPRAAESALA